MLWNYSMYLCVCHAIKEKDVCDILAKNECHKLSDLYKTCGQHKGCCRLCVAEMKKILYNAKNNVSKPLCEGRK